MEENLEDLRNIYKTVDSLTDEIKKTAVRIENDP